MSSTLESPFAGALGSESALPKLLRDQYLVGPDDEFDVVLGGKMARVWHRPWAWPILRLLARFDILVPDAGTDVPTILEIRLERDSRGRPVHLWTRTFHFPGRRWRYRSTMDLDDETSLVGERQGPRGALEELAEIRFVPPGRIEIRTVRSRFRIGRRAVALPRRLWITAVAIQDVVDTEYARSHIELTVSLGRLGPIFGYEGTFRAARRPRRR